MTYTGTFLFFDCDKRELMRITIKNLHKNNETKKKIKKKNYITNFKSYLNLKYRIRYELT